MNFFSSVNLYAVCDSWLEDQRDLAERHLSEQEERVIRFREPLTDLEKVKTAGARKAIGVEKNSFYYEAARKIAIRTLTKTQLMKVDFWYGDVFSEDKSQSEQPRKCVPRGQRGQICDRQFK
jgi:hypothetical protein